MMLPNIKHPSRRYQRGSERGILMAELYVAIAIFSLLVLAAAAPLAMDQKYVRTATHRTVAMELVDGEMEVLAAGAWHGYAEGVQDYVMEGEAAKSLPPGKFVLAIDSQSVSLEWRERLSDRHEAVRVKRAFRRPQ